MDTTHDDGARPEERSLPVPRPPLPPTDALPPPPAPAREPAPPQVKSPALAAFLSVIPGLGHLYVESYQRAIMLVTAIFLSIYLLPLPLSVFAPMFIWFLGLFDAYRLAQLANLDERRPTPPPRPRDGSLAFGVFLLVVGAILLVDRFVDIDLSWLIDWWPALLVLGGLYFILNAWRERGERRREGVAEDDSNF